MTQKNTPTPPASSAARRTRRPARRTAKLLALLALPLGIGAGAHLARAQDRTITFGVAETGVNKAITEWGLDTAWPSYDNMHRGITYMGADQVDLVRVAFPIDAPPVNGQLAAAQLADLTNRVNLANLAGANKPVSITPDNGAGIDPWFRNGSSTEIVPSRWVQNMEASMRALDTLGKTVVSAAPFNEPDYAVSPVGQGTVTNLYDILGLLQTSAEFSGVPLAGASTLNCDQANPWYNVIKSRVSEGTTHQLAGSFDSYASFYQNVRASGDRAVNEELHNVVECIVGAEYGLQTGIWWGTAELARAEFIKANQGVRLGYAEHRPNWTAAAVYRAPTGAVKAFVGASERQAVTTSYRFVSKDRDVFFDGHGPQRDHTVVIPGGNGYWIDQPNAEKLVNITWGADVQPAINGRYILVNRNSAKVLAVASGSTADGANIEQTTYTGATNQQWDVVPLDSRTGGDYSYFTLRAAHSGKGADLLDWSHADGANILQWPAGGGNQHYFLEYVADGWFHIRNRWSGKYLDVDNGSTADGANVFQWTGNGGLNQQWRLLPVGAAVEFVAPAAPAGLAATANPVSVRLTWNANGEADLAGYNVLRADSASGPWSLVARGLSATTFTDRSANQNRAYHYVVQAADRSLNRSAHSSAVSATPSGAAALVARYNFDGNLDDGSGNANHATVQGTATYNGARVGTNAFAFDGSTRHVNLPGDIASFGQLTVAAWVYWNGGAAWQRVFDFGNGTDQYLFLTPRADGAGLRFAIKNGGAEQQLNASALPTGQWVHVAVTLGASSAQLYVNGAQVATSTAVTLRPSAFKPVLNYVGKSQWPDPLFNGRIDDFRVYNSGLSAAAVAELATGVPSGAYSLQNRANGKMLDNYGATTDGASVRQYDSGPSANQRWTVSTITGGYRKFQCFTGGKMLDTLGNTANDTPIGQWSDGPSNNQQWTLVHIDSGYYRVVNRANGKALDTGGDNANGAVMENWSVGSSHNQQWRFVD